MRIASFPFGARGFTLLSRVAAVQRSGHDPRAPPHHYRGNDMAISEINVRNQFRGKIKEIIHGPVVSEVDVETQHGIVTSVITSRSIQDLDLKVGSEVIALVKSTEVSIAKIQ
jgi:molybdopterin-binding protein